MDLLLSPKLDVPAQKQGPVVIFREKVYTALTSWEIYPIVLVAAFLRLFRIDKAIFGQDEANVYQLAHDAVTRGFLPLASDRSSIGNSHPPIAVYFYMIPALLSANPLWGQVFVALLNTVAVLLAYFFTRRYYGRLAGTITAALFATAVGVWMYSRSIWSPNIEPLLIVLFIWQLFRGVVERRKGWLVPALVLLGVLYQLHESTLYLLVPLLAAVIMAFKTIRKRDFAYALIGLLVVFAPFLTWEFHDGFFDLKSIFSTTQQRAVYDLTDLRNYLFFIHPTLNDPYTTLFARTRDNHLLFPDEQSVLVTTPLHYARVLLEGGYGLALLLLFGGMLIAAVLVLFPRLSRTTDTLRTANQSGLRGWCAGFQASPTRQGFLLLLIWQIAPLILFVRHSLVLFDHYFLFLLPGPFIFMAIAVVQTIEFVRKQRPAWERLARYGVVALAALIILAQLIGTSGTLLDLTGGRFDDRSVYPNYVDLHSQQNALQAADQLAQQRGIHRIYVTTDYYTYQGLVYLAAQMKTPVAFNNVAQPNTNTQCFVLPNLSAGPVVLLLEPDMETSAILALLNQFTNATLVSSPEHLGGAPYRLYVLSAKSSPAPVAQTFAQGLQSLAPSASFLPGTRLLTTRWRITATQSAHLRTIYHYGFQLQSNGLSARLDCQLSATWGGDQLFLFQDLSTQDTPTQVRIQATMFISRPTLIQSGPLTLTSASDISTPVQQLLTAGQKNTLTFPVETTS